MRLITELSIEDEDIKTYIHTYEDATLFITTTHGLISLITCEDVIANEYLELFFDIYKSECYYSLLNDEPFKCSETNMKYINKLYLELTAELFNKT
jgi:hypothetical protein